jgi:tRNA-dihydrouridine synthase
LSDLVSAHYEAMLGFYGEDLGGKVARKHLGWYMDGAATPAALRREDIHRWAAKEDIKTITVGGDPL